jgi:DNA topoisomerase-3
LYKEFKCPLDKFELVLFSLGNTANAQGKSYPLCPYCYSHPPSFNEDSHSIESVMSSSEDISDSNGPSKPKGNLDLKAPKDEDIEDGVTGHHSGMGCDSCMHPTCKHSATFNGICECPGANASGEPCDGMLVLDVNSKPNWKLSCNRCNTLLRFKADIHDITPLPRQECNECGLKLTKFEFSKLKTTLPNGETIRQGCIMCDDFLNSLTEIILGRTINVTVLRQMRQRRAAAGGRRGRGRKRGDPKMSFSDF